MAGRQQPSADPQPAVRGEQDHGTAWRRTWPLRGQRPTGHRQDHDAAGCDRAIVVERALRLAELASPQDAFHDTESGTWSTSEWEHTVVAPHPSLTGFEIVVAAANNGAVENVTTQIPGPAAIGPQWRPRASDLDYFSATAAQVHGEGAWAMVAARLGKRANRGGFVNSFWWSPAGQDDRGGMHEREKSSPWADEEFTAARTELFLAALGLHKAFLTATAPTVRGNLEALMDILAGRGQQALSRLYGVTAEWAPSRTSVQRLADQAAPYGTWLRTATPDGSGRVWVGTPLRVHRRRDPHQPGYDRPCQQRA